MPAPGELVLEPVQAVQAAVGRLAKVVLVEMLSIAIVSVFILALIYRPYHEMMLNSVDWIVGRQRNLAIFMLALLLMPLILLFL